LAGGFGVRLPSFGGGTAGSGGALDPRALPTEQGISFPEKVQRRLGYIEQNLLSLTRAAESQGSNHRYRETRFSLISALNDASLFSMLSNSFYLAGTELASIADAPTANPADIKAISQSLLSSSAAAFAAAQNRVVLQSYISRRDRLSRGMLYTSDKSWRENFHVLTSLQEATAAADTALDAGKAARDPPGGYSYSSRDYSYDTYRSRRDDGDDRRDRERGDRDERSRRASSRRNGDDADRDRRNDDGPNSSGRRRSRSTN